MFEHKPSDLLHVYFLDIGQGDSIFIDSPTHGRILLDGGQGRKVLSELGNILPFGDRRIDVMIESHPDADHISGLPEVVSEYDVGAFLEPGVESPNKVDNELHARVEAKKIPDLLARRNMVVDFGDGAKLVYGNESFLLTGDSTKKAEYILLGLDKNILQSTVLKAGHHGSDTSSSLPYLEAVAPTYAVISAGAGNSYGLPKQDTLDNLKKVGATILSTESAGGLTGQGTIEFETDGTALDIK